MLKRLLIGAVMFAIGFVGVRFVLAQLNDGSVADDVPALSAWPTIQGQDFTVRLPREPEKTVTQVPTAGGPMNAVMYSVEAGSDALVLTVAGYSAQAAYDLDGGVRGMAAAVKGQIASSKHAVIAGAKARRFRITGVSKGHDITAFGVILKKNRRVFMLQYLVAHKNATVAPAIYRQVLKSLVIAR